VPGEGWDQPERLDHVTVHYVGKLHGTEDVFDSSRDRGEPFAFTLGKGEVISGWDLGVATMKRGEKALLVCSAEHAYGAAGSPPKIPPGATLDFEVELLTWRSVKDVEGDGGLIKTVVAEGEGWQTPGDADEVVVRYEVRRAAVSGEEEEAVEEGAEGEAGEAGAAGAADKKKKKKKATSAEAAENTGPVLLSSPEGGATFTVRDGHLCRGLARAVRTMKPGERAVLRVRAADYGGQELAAALLAAPPSAADGGGGCEGGDGDKGGGEGGAACEFAEVDVTLLEVHKVEEVCPGVVKKTLNEVDGWKRPNDGARVSLRVRATLPPAAAAAAPAAAASAAAAAAPAAAASAAAAPAALTADPPAPFWERLEGDELEVVLGEGAYPHPLPECLEDAILKMREGERCVVTVTDAELAYGAAGWPDAPLGVPVPPGAAPLSFDVELVSVLKSKEQWEMAAGDKLAAAARKKARGDGAYGGGGVRAALKCYAQAGELLALVTDRDLEDVQQAQAGAGPAAFDPIPEPMALDGGEDKAAAADEAAAEAFKAPAPPLPAELRRALRDLKKAVALNQAAAALRAKDYPLAREAATRALDADPSNAKALYRRAQALAALGELVEAEGDVRAALDADPGSADVLALQRRVRLLAREADRKAAAVYGRMLGGLGGKAGKKVGAAAAAAAGGGEGAAAAAAAAAPADEAEAGAGGGGDTAAAPAAAAAAVPAAAVAAADAPAPVVEASA